MVPPGEIALHVILPVVVSVNIKPGSADPMPVLLKLGEINIQNFKILPSAKIKVPPFRRINAKAMFFHRLYQQIAVLPDLRV